jgi:hypothetical protein
VLQQPKQKETAEAFGIFYDAILGSKWKLSFARKHDQAIDNAYMVLSLLFQKLKKQNNRGNAE